MAKKNSNPMQLEKGQRVQIDMNGPMLDIDVLDWLIDEDIKDGIVIIESFDDSYAFVEGCEYAIQREYIKEVKES